MYAKSLLLIFTFIFSSTTWSMTDEFPNTEGKRIYKFTAKDKDKDNKDCRKRCEVEASATSRQDDTQTARRYGLLYDGVCCKGCCASQLSTYAGQGEHHEQIDRYQLFSSSFLYGAVCNLVPEVCRDALEARGYPPRTSTVMATIIQGVMIAYNTSSYMPTIAGIAVRVGFSHLGFSDQASVIAGSTAAIVTSLSQKLIFSHETALDCMIDCALGVAGSYTGSSLALKAKSLIYERWGSSNAIKYVKLTGSVASWPSRL